MRKMFLFTIWVTLIMAQSLIVLLAIWQFYPYRVLEIRGDAFEVLNKKVKGGEDLKFISDNCKYMNLSSRTSRAFVDGIINYVSPTTSDIRVGCGKVTVSVRVPQSLNPGTYYLQNIYEYQVNPIRTIVVKHNTEKFIVE